MHLLEETARHGGHADIIRELIDGCTGRLPQSSRNGRAPAALASDAVYLVGHEVTTSHFGLPGNAPAYGVPAAIIAAAVVAWLRAGRRLTVN
jgi:hypothetical protein